MGHSRRVRTAVAVLVVLALPAVAGVARTSVAADPSADPTRFTGSNFWQTPDDPSLDITGPIDIRVAVRMDDWTPPSNGNGTRVTFASKWGNTDGAWGLQLITSDDGSFPNRLLMIWDDETGGSSSRSVVGPTVGAADGTLLGIRATLEPAILRVRFFSKATTEATALADIGSDTGWSQLGSDITGAASPPINSTSDPVTIGTLRPQDAALRLYDANIYAVVVKNGVNGTTVLNPDLGAQPDGETNFTDGAGRSWTEKGHVAHRWRANGDALDSIGTNHGTLQPAVNGATASGTPAAEGSNAFSLDGADDYVTMPQVSTHYFPGSFSIEAWVNTSDTDDQKIISKYECGGACPTGSNSMYWIGTVGGVPYANLRDTDAGGPDGIETQQIEAATSITGSFHHLRFVRDVENGLLAIYIDGVISGLEALHPGAAGAIVNDDAAESDPLVIGAVLTNTFTSHFNGLIDDVQLSTEGAVDPADFDPSLTDTEPDSPANDNNPEIKGSAVAGSTVKLYTNANCTGSHVASGPASDFASPGLTVNVADDSTTTFFATATVGSATSSCSTSSISYTEQTTVAAQFLADQHIKRSKDASFLGNNTHNTSGLNQTVLAKTKRGRKAVFNIVVQNDGTDPDAFTVTGCKKSRGFKVSYLDGATNITSQVTTSGFTTPTVAPGGTRALLLTIKVKAAGPKKKTCAVTATSQGNSSQDVVIGKVKAKG